MIIQYVHFGKIGQHNTFTIACMELIYKLPMSKYTTQDIALVTCPKCLKLLKGELP